MIRQIEHLEFLDADRAELGVRRRQHLHRAELQRLELFLVLVELRVRIDFDLHLAVGVLLGQFLELFGAMPFGVLGATTWLNLMTIGACADAGPISANAATDAAAKINLRMFPPRDFREARRARLPTLYASGTNTEKPDGTPLPVSRGRQKPCCNAKNAAPGAAFFMS